MKGTNINWCDWSLHLHFWLFFLHCNSMYMFKYYKSQLSFSNININQQQASNFIF